MMIDRYWIEPVAWQFFVGPKFADNLLILNAGSRKRGHSFFKNALRVELIMP